MSRLDATTQESRGRTARMWMVAGIGSLLWAVPAWCQEAAVDAATPTEGAAETAGEGFDGEGFDESAWILGGETDEGFTVEAIPIPDLTGLESTVAKQLENLVDNLKQSIESGELSRNQLGELYGETGQVFHAYEFTGSAAPCYHNATLLLPGDPRWPHLMGYLYQQSGELEKARQQYALALESGDNLATRLRQVEIELQDDNLETAERALESILAEQPELLAARALMAEVQLAKANFEQAIAGFESVLAQAPGANRYHYSLALAYRDNRQMDKARFHMSKRGEVGLSLGDHLVEGLEERKRGERVYLLRGRRAFAAGRYGEAAEAFAAAVEAEPASARSRVNLGSALAADGKPQEAIQQFRIVLELEPENATAHYNLGRLLYGSEQPIAALPHFRKVAESDPKDVEVRMLMGQLMRRFGQPDEALQVYGEAVAIAPNSEEARLRQAAVLVDQGRYAEGRAKLEDAVAVMPQEGRLLRALAQLLAASPDRAVRDGDKALELARTIWKANSTAAHAELVAQAYGELEQCDRASSWQQVALDMASSDSQERLASMQQTLAYYQQARPCRPPS